MDIKQKIYKCLYNAQAFSDAAKSIYILEDYDLSSDECYDNKDKNILLAIRLINKYNNKNFKFFCERTRDQHGHRSFIVYFTVNNKQMSFHCFNKNLWKYVHKGYYTEWNGLLDGSRQTAKYLKDKYL